MISKVYASNKNSLSLCMDELRKKELDDFENGCDFYFFAIHPSFPVDDIAPTIEDFFKTENYAAFHALNAFNDNQINDIGIVMCCIKFQKSGKAKTFYIEDIHNNPEKAAKECVNYFHNNKDHFHLIFAGLAEGTFGFFLEKVSENIDHGLASNIVGGISSGNEQNGEVLTYQFTDGKVIKNGLLIVTFENIEAAIEISLGFKPYGITYQVDYADGYNLYSVNDGKSFAEVTKRLLKGIDNPDIRYLWYAPLYILDENDGYVATLRTVAGIEGDHVKLYGPIKKGDHFKLSFAVPEDLLEENIYAAARLKKRVTKPELSFDFSCMARQYAMEDKQKEEPIIYTKSLDSNLFGFFTYGEIGPDKKFKKLKLYNETSLLVAMREK
ncbi:FIST C-terminal domain-containing protein [Hydrogenimonas thermophila]|uniref:FIST N domain-containing protein n=1 Tax=Hydrogenimonas thermophila TaxID=223786 RepID=A0A1I5SA03_9BACT|nr:FIST C-terminal domain-containing protein [Hydrogenimonas thermophila]WOE70775.1 FIST C-terminal domain-containing protein [Hydrogenimonas thermophila]WOE73293.1 FIST C-terminal domain-containing protein [Hydrogenimonas thermophila]SFP67543.1 FIST N domain-containing protein [Hydrogenimonas thermophila]